MIVISLLSLLLWTVHSNVWFHPSSLELEVETGRVDTYEVKIKADEKSSVILTMTVDRPEQLEGRCLMEDGEEVHVDTPSEETVSKLQETVEELLRLPSNIGVDDKELFRLDRMLVGFSCNPLQFRRRLQSESPRDRFLRHLDAASHVASLGGVGQQTRRLGSLMSEADVGNVETIYVAAAADTTEISAQNTLTYTGTSVICYIDVVELKRQDWTLVRSLLESFNRLPSSHTHTHSDAGEVDADSVAFLLPDVDVEILPVDELEELNQHIETQAYKATEEEKTRKQEIFSSFNATNTLTEGINSENTVGEDPLRPLQWHLDACADAPTLMPLIRKYGLEDSKVMAASRECTLESWVDIDEVDAISTLEANTYGEDAIIVAVLDSGVNVLHPDISGNVWVNKKEKSGEEGVDDDLNSYKDDINGYNFLDGNATVMDNCGHGTHVAGILAAVRGNGTGITGVAPQGSVKIMPLKFLNEKNVGPISAVMPALEYARKNGASVVTNSWGAKEGIASKVVQESLRQAVLDSNGMLLIFAAGNTHTNISEEFHFPPSLKHDWALSIAAYDSKGDIAWFSSYGESNVHIAAPGVHITSTWLGTEYKIMNGTSMAVPVVAGVAVAVLKRRPLLSVQALKQIIVDSATLPPTDKDRERKPKKTITGRHLNMSRAVALSERYFVGLPNKEYHITMDTPSSGGFPELIHGDGRRRDTMYSYNLSLAIDTRGMDPGRYEATLYVRRSSDTDSQTCGKSNIYSQLPITLIVTQS
eukprot:GHVR01179832.1.p1 GENE.GHVR01179832.1~~GHVR01179832.1.p1  ORF type:complete len:761 (+),score=136.00 GHVR01179832.1:50-2332(+)